MSSICELNQRSLRESFRLGIIISSPQPVKLRWGRSQPWPQLRGRIFFTLRKAMKEKDASLYHTTEIQVGMDHGLITDADQIFGLDSGDTRRVDYLHGTRRYWDGGTFVVGLLEDASEQLDIRMVTGRGKTARGIKLTQRYFRNRTKGPVTTGVKIAADQ